jgi:hypothetical protein
MCDFLMRQEGIGVMVISCDNTLPLHYLVSHSFAAEEVRLRARQKRALGGPWVHVFTTNMIAMFTQAQLRSVLAMMIAKGASVNSQTAQGTTPLMRYILLLSS